MIPFIRTHLRRVPLERDREDRRDFEGVASLSYCFFWLLSSPLKTVMVFSVIRAASRATPRAFGVVSLHAIPIHQAISKAKVGEEKVMRNFRDRAISRIVEVSPAVGSRGWHVACGNMVGRNGVE